MSKYVDYEADGYDRQRDEEIERYGFGRRGDPIIDTARGLFALDRARLAMDRHSAVGGNPPEGDRT